MSEPSADPLNEPGGCEMMPAWFPLTAIALVMVSSGFGLAMIIRVQREKRRRARQPGESPT